MRRVLHVLVVRPLVLLGLGLNVRHRERLPVKGPAILVANHNSHLDTLVLMTLFPLRLLTRLRPVAAADYFLRNKLTSWLSRNLMGILPIRRDGGGGDPLAAVVEALDRGEMVILFPEGSRGEPEVRETFKAGVAHLSKRRPAVPVVPVFMHGLGKALPRGEWILVPFFCDIFIGPPVPSDPDRRKFMGELTLAMDALAAEGEFPPWL